MSKNPENENELWDLIQDQPEEAPAAPAKAKSPAPAAEKKSPWMFVSCGLGAALIVSLMMLFSGGNDGGNSVSPSTPVSGGNNSAQVQELQAQVDNLTDQRELLLAQIDALNEEVTSQDMKIDELLKLYNQMSENLEYVESNAVINGNANAEKLQRTMEAYTLLILAQDAFLRLDAAEVDSYVDQLMDSLDVFDQDMLNAFYNVMEYMEQPYWRNQN